MIIENQGEQTTAGAKETAIEMARLMAETRCEDVLVFDIKGLSRVTDYVVIGTGTSERQMHSVSEDVAELGQSMGHGVFRMNQERGSSWMIVDFVDITVHLFEPNTRAFYDLEHLWSDAQRIEWKRDGSATPVSTGRNGSVHLDGKS